MARYGLTLVTPPPVEPVSLVEARKHVEIPHDYKRHDDQLSNLITAARQQAELRTGRQIITATWDLVLDSFQYGETYLLVPKPPLQSAVITYVDTAGVTQTWSSANYVVSTSREPGRIALAYDSSWPDIRLQPDAVKVRFVAGYGLAAACPEGLKHAILLTIGHWFDHREDAVVGTIASEMPNAAKDLLRQYECGEEFVEYAEC